MSRVELKNNFYDTRTTRAQSPQREKQLAELVCPFVRARAWRLPIAASKYARLIYGRGGQIEKSYPYRGQWKSTAAKWKNPGWYIERRNGKCSLIRLENSRGKLVATWPITKTMLAACRAARRGKNGKWQPEHYPYISYSQELVRHCVAACGWGRIAQALQAETIRAENDMELVRVPMEKCGEREDMIILRVICPSTQAHYALRVPPEFVDLPCEAARRWTLDLPTDVEIIAES